MSALTPVQTEELVAAVRAYLGITWTDESLDAELRRSVASSASRLESIYGYPLAFIDEDGVERTDADYLATDLLLARCFYIREKALDDFEPNYSRALLGLRSYGKVRRLKERKENAVGE